MVYRKCHRRMNGCGRVNWLWASYDDNGKAQEVFSDTLGAIDPDSLGPDKLKAIFERESFQTEFATYTPSGCRKQTYEKEHARWVI